MNICWGQAGQFTAKATAERQGNNFKVLKGEIQSQTNGLDCLACTMLARQRVALILIVMGGLMKSLWFKRIQARIPSPEIVKTTANQGTSVLQDLTGHNP